MSLQEVWEAAAGSPFSPSVSKEYQLTAGFTLLLTALIFTVLFGLSTISPLPACTEAYSSQIDLSSPYPFLAYLLRWRLGSGLSLLFAAWEFMCSDIYHTLGGVVSALAEAHSRRYHNQLPATAFSGLKMNENEPPILTAVSSSARQLFLLLRCISFASKAEVQITSEGLRFSAEEARVLQGLVFLGKVLFSSFTFNQPRASNNNPSEDSLLDSTTIPNFQVSLVAVLETLQIFGISDPTNLSHRHPNGGFTSSYTTAFNTPALALGGTCKISYPHIGAPLSITLSESGVTTTCDLMTYEPAFNYVDSDEDDTSIPFQRDALTMKIIMRSTWLHDAISELSSTNPAVLVLSASGTTAPFFALEGVGGPFGDSTVEFQPASKSDSSDPSTTAVGFYASSKKRAPLVTETFSISPPSDARGRIRQRYKFDLIKKAGRAMALASKVSIRGDRQGVLSLQFMIEFGDGGSVGGGGGGARDVAGGMAANGASAASGAGTGGGKVSFVDFRFVPLVDEEDESDEEDVEVEMQSTGSGD